jgi:hypothetical protein
MEELTIVAVDIQKLAVLGDSNLEFPKELSRCGLTAESVAGQRRLLFTRGEIARSDTSESWFSAGAHYQTVLEKTEKV